MKYLGVDLVIDSGVDTPMNATSKKPYLSIAYGTVFARRFFPFPV